MGTDKVVIVVKDGMVREVFGASPYKFDVLAILISIPQAF